MLTPAACPTLRRQRRSRPARTLRVNSAKAWSLRAVTWASRRRFLLDPVLVQAITDPSSNPAVAEAAESFFLALALCNNAMPARKKDEISGVTPANRPMYSALI
eukprot:Opistho-2@58077